MRSFLLFVALIPISLTAQITLESEHVFEGEMYQVTIPDGWFFSPNPMARQDILQRDSQFISRKFEDEKSKELSEDSLDILLVTHMDLDITDIDSIYSMIHERDTVEGMKILEGTGIHSTNGYRFLRLHAIPIDKEDRAREIDYIAVEFGKFLVSFMVILNSNLDTQSPITDIMNSYQVVPCSRTNTMQTRKELQEAFRQAYSDNPPVVQPGPATEEGVPAPPPAPARKTIDD